MTYCPVTADLNRHLKRMAEDEDEAMAREEWEEENSMDDLIGSDNCNEILLLLKDDPEAAQKALEREIDRAWEKHVEDERKQSFDDRSEAAWNARYAA